MTFLLNLEIFEIYTAWPLGATYPPPKTKKWALLTHKHDSYQDKIKSDPALSKMSKNIKVFIKVPQILTPYSGPRGPPHKFS